MIDSLSCDKDCYSVSRRDQTTVETLNNWALELARLGIAVFFCPIIVSQTIKCRDNEIDVIINSDQELMTDYFALLTELQDSSGDAISCSHGFRSKTEDICLKSFASESQFICISQATSNPHLPYPMKVKKVITKYLFAENICCCVYLLNYVLIIEIILFCRINI